ncbi:unnamed protein product [Closterium sp. NIES-65]|nr:unnamed protein product [Closterium sp. NIES-65]
MDTPLTDPFLTDSPPVVARALQDENESLVSVVEQQHQSIAALRHRATTAEREKRSLKDEVALLREALAARDEQMESLAARVEEAEEERELEEQERAEDAESEDEAQAADGISAQFVVGSRTGNGAEDSSGMALPAGTRTRRREGTICGGGGGDGGAGGGEEWREEDGEQKEVVCGYHGCGDERGFRIRDGVACRGCAALFCNTPGSAAGAGCAAVASTAGSVPCTPVHGDSPRTLAAAAAAAAAALAAPASDFVPASGSSAVVSVNMSSSRVAGVLGRRVRVGGLGFRGGMEGDALAGRRSNDTWAVPLCFGAAGGVAAVSCLWALFLALAAIGCWAICASAQCASPLQSCDFYFYGYDKAVPVLKLKSVRDEKVVTTGLRWKGQSLFVETATTLGNSTCKVVGQKKVFCDNYFFFRPRGGKKSYEKYINRSDRLGIRPIPKWKLRQLSNQCIQMGVDSAKIKILKAKTQNASVWINPNDNNAEFPQKRRCVAFKIVTA